MAKTVDMPANRKAPKWRVRHRNRCQRVVVRAGYLRKFEMCRLCFRQLALRGDIPGVIKSSW